MGGRIRIIGLAGLAAMLLLAAAGDRRRIAYLPVPVDDAVLPWRAGPRIAYPKVPRDERLAYDAERSDPPRPAIWRIGDADTTIYLFATIHVLPPGFAWRNAGVDRVVAEADTLILESVDDGARVAGLIPQTPAGPALPPLYWRVSPDHRAKLMVVLAGLPRDASDVLSSLPTWMAAVAIGFVRDYRRGETPGPGADDWLERAFRARGAGVESIEDGAQVMAGVNAIPEKEQRRMLDAALDAVPGTRAAARAPIEAWARGDVGPGSALAADIARSGGPLSDRLLMERNRAWALRLRKKLAVPGTMLFAGGAGHFVGAESVIALIERGGVRVTRVQ